MLVLQLVIQVLQLVILVLQLVILVLQLVILVLQLVILVLQLVILVIIVIITDTTRHAASYTSSRGETLRLIHFHLPFIHDLYTYI